MIIKQLKTNIEDVEIIEKLLTVLGSFRSYTDNCNWQDLHVLSSSIINPVGRFQISKFIKDTKNM